MLTHRRRSGRAEAASGPELRGIEKESLMRFPDHFQWGAAAAAYQIEGAADIDGRGRSVWDAFCQRDGTIWGGHTGDMACDHYHRYVDDIALMKRIGLKAYRLSISWPRVLPSGAGPVNAMGLDYYDRLIDELIAAGITPFVTLFHWDLPLALQDRGGWMNRASADWFAEYASLMAQRLSDRVEYWITINEPQVFLAHGHLIGTHAPGLKLDRGEVLKAGHHVLLAHGKAVQAIRAAATGPCSIGFAPVGVVCMPATTREPDIEAARKAMFSVNDDSLSNNTWWMDPPLRGEYPEDGLRRYGRDAPPIEPGDMEVIHQPLDFFGHNTYTGQHVRASDAGPEGVPPAVGHKVTTFRWAVTPEILYWGPRFFHERYGLPIYITENGMANTDWVALDGKVHDPQRIDFVHRHLLELGRAITDGVDVRGFFYWSILDNFEWAEGYRERFGLIHVDYATQQRTLKDSALWYADVIATHGQSLNGRAVGAVESPV
jgi:beta-glucosidase